MLFFNCRGCVWIEARIGGPVGTKMTRNFSANCISARLLNLGHLVMFWMVHILKQFFREEFNFLWGKCHDRPNLDELSRYRDTHPAPKISTK